MRFARNPGEWLWRRLRLSTWVTRRKADKLTATTAKVSPDDTKGGRGRLT
jgi:hypothetical protein